VAMIQVPKKENFHEKARPVARAGFRSFGF
jgi:hypothetical protein